MVGVAGAMTGDCEHVVGETKELCWQGGMKSNKGRGGGGGGASNHGRDKSRDAGGR